MPGELLGAQDCQSSVSAVLTRRFLPVETCLEFNSNADLKGVTFMDIGLPNQAYQAGVDWADDPSLSTVTTMCAQVGSGIRYKDGQRKGKAASQLSPPPPNYFLFWLVGFQTTRKG